MSPASIKFYGFGMLGLGLVCLLLWGLNSLGLIRVGSPTGELIMAPICIAIAWLILRPRINRH